MVNDSVQHFWLHWRWKTVAGLANNLQCRAKNIRILDVPLKWVLIVNVEYPKMVTSQKLWKDNISITTALSSPVTDWLTKCDTFGGKKRLLSERDQSGVGRIHRPRHNNRCSHGASPLQFSAPIPSHNGLPSLLSRILISPGWSVVKLLLLPILFRPK